MRPLPSVSPETNTPAPPAAPVVVVDGVSKRFELKAGRRSTELRERFGNLLRRDNSKRLVQEAKPDDIFWALRDVSFEVKPGQPVGIVGHNGSGKSTMLKLLTGIMKPTQGSVKVKGRIGALIEVGAGFHPDLTGRENVYLSGSILGLSRRDIDQRFDRIVQFANLEQFIDTPVKRYSSGMYMRLGFAVAAHTDPDVLLIDEVLAVGDTLFQRKCLAHLKEFVKQGGAVVFVSHAMGQVAELCSTCVWLDHGQVRYVGETAEAIDQYMAVVTEREEAEWQRMHPEEWELLQAERKQEAEDAARLEEEARAQARLDAERAALEAERAAQEAQAKQLEEAESAKLREAARKAAHLANYDRPRLLGLHLTDKNNAPCTAFKVGEAVNVHIKYQFTNPPVNPVFGVEFFRADGLAMFGTSNYDHQIWYKNLPMVGQIVLHIPALGINEGEYRVRYRQFSDCTIPDWPHYADDTVEDAARFTVDGGAFAHGCAFMPAEWETVAKTAARTQENARAARARG